MDEMEKKLILWIRNQEDPSNAMQVVKETILHRIEQNKNIT